MWVTVGAVAATYYISWGPDAAENRTRIANAIDNLAGSTAIDWLVPKVPSKNERRPQHIFEGTRGDQRNAKVQHAARGGRQPLFEELPKICASPSAKAQCVLLALVAVAAVHQGMEGEELRDSPYKAEDTEEDTDPSQPSLDTVTESGQGSSDQPPANHGAIPQGIYDQLTHDYTEPSPSDSDDHWWPDWY